MRTRSDAEPRRGLLDPPESEVRRIDRFSSPSEAGDAMNDDRDVAFVYYRGRYSGSQVTRADVQSQGAGHQARGALIDALARYVCQEELSPSDARGYIVFCSVL